MASSLSQIRVACSTMKMSSFPLAREKNKEAMKSCRFLQYRRTRDRRNPRRLPDFRFTHIRPLLWSFCRFWSNFNGIEMSNEEEYSILGILYCYSLQQHIFLAFCNDFDTLSLDCSQSPIFPWDRDVDGPPTWSLWCERNWGEYKMPVGRGHGAEKIGRL